MPSEQNINLKNDEIRSVVLPNGTVLHNGDREYTIEEFLGAGGFGITYRASAKIMVNNVPVDVPVNFAIKEFLMKGGERENDSITVRYPVTLRQQAEEAKKDFVGEAKRLNKLSVEAKHLNKLSGGAEHIVPVNEVFLENNTVYYVMQYLKGGEVADYVLERGRLPEDQAIAIIRPVAEAVEVIHKEKLLHLDIKPGNIVFKEPPTEHLQCPVLIDFGIAKHFDSNGKPTSTNSPGGYSPGYAPQEQYGPIDHFAPQIDVYALGATLYALLVGKDPKEAYAITEEDILANLPENISECTRQTILNAMKKDPKHRTPSAHAFLDSLRGVFPLQAGFVIGDMSSPIRYRITSVREVEHSHPSYIVYNAVIAAGENVEDEAYAEQMAARADGEDVGQSANVTERKNVLAVVSFIVYELFSKSDSVRKDDGSVRGSSEVAKRDFQNAIDKTNKRKLIGQKTGSGTPLAELFEANGTSYFVYLIQERPPLPIRIWNAVAAGAKAVGRLFSRLFNAVARGIKAFFAGIISCFKWIFNASRAAVSKLLKLFRQILKPLAYAIVGAALATAAFFGGKQILRSCEQQDNKSEPLAITDPAMIETDSTQKDSSDVIPNHPDTTPVVPPQRVIPEPKPILQPDIRDPELTKTDEEKFEEAKNSKDYKTLISLANAGFAKAYYEVANYYFNLKDYPSASSFAKKAIKANVNDAAAKKLLDKIKKIEQPPIPEPPVVQETDDQRYKKAKGNNDYPALINLANGGYAKAYIDVANYYFNQKNYDEAKRYAQMAVNAGINMDEAKQMLSTIDDLIMKQSAFSKGKSLYEKWVASGDSITRIQALAALRNADQNNPIVKKMLDVLANYKRKNYKH